MEPVCSLRFSGPLSAILSEYSGVFLVPPHEHRDRILTSQQRIPSTFIYIIIRKSFYRSLMNVSDHTNTPASYLVGSHFENTRESQ
jgi:hypothetical protein